MPEPEWDAEQQGLMLALAAYRRLLCPCGCGHMLADTTAPEGTVSWHVPTPPACTARMKLAASQQRMKDFPNPEALLWHVEKR